MPCLNVLAFMYIFLRISKMECVKSNNSPICACRNMREESAKMLKKVFCTKSNFLRTSVDNRSSYGGKQSYTASDV